MGTPGDKIPVSKVVQDDEVADVEDETTGTTNMTILQNVPALGIFIENDPALQQLQTFESFEKQLFLEPTPLQDLCMPGPSGLQTPKTTKQSEKIAPKRKKSIGAQKKSHMCSICSKNFQTSAKLASHQLVHSGGTPFKCEHCKKSFSSKFKLVRHVLIHSDRKPFSCTVCERTFHRKDHLKNHIKVHSPSKKVYICEKTNCKKEYTSVMSYRKHLALHSAEEGSLECKICSKVFETKPDILYHLKIHAGSRTVKNPNEKKFTCDYCDRKFFTRKDVRRHLVVHTGTRNFLCQFCPQRFGRKDHLVRHIKKSHSKNFSELESGDKSSSSSSFIDIKTETNLEMPQIQNILNYESMEPENKSNIKLEGIPEVQNLLFPMLCSEAPLPSDSELLTELDVMKEELEGSSQQLLPSDIIDTDLLRLISEDEHNLPLPGFSQVFKHQEPPPPPPPS